jgi:hypothetical protein
MTNDDFPAGVSPEVAASAARPLDETDQALLDELADVLTLVDPVPEDLVTRVQFSLALDEVYAEVAEITRVQHDALAVRSDPTVGMRTETLTFTAERVTAMVTVSRAGPDQLRLDGWLAPSMAARVVLRMQEGTQEVTADESGRFAFEGVPEGFAQLTIATGPDPEDAVVTPLFQL